MLVRIRSVVVLAVAFAGLCGCVDRAPPQANGPGSDADNVADGAPLEDAAVRHAPRRAFSVPAEASGMEERERVIQDTVFPLEVALNAETVLCASADYSDSFLKIVIPGVANVTLFDHRNASVGAPCIAAGPCTEEHNPQTLLQHSDAPQDEIALRVLLTGIYAIDHDQQTCTVLLKEELFTTIRDVPFYHERQGMVSERAYADCLGL